METKKILLIGGGVVVAYLLYKGWSDKKAKDLIASNLIASDLATKTADCEAKFLENEKTVRRSAGFDKVAYKTQFMKDCLNATPETGGAEIPLGTGGIKTPQENPIKGNIMPLKSNTMTLDDNIIRGQAEQAELSFAGTKGKSLAGQYYR